MAITKIKVSNFKSFRDIEIELGPLTILIGANASGKSNFIRIFEFLRDTANHGLVNAVSMQGGVEYLRNMNVGSSQPLSIAIVLDEKFRFPAFTRKDGIGFEAQETRYGFGLTSPRGLHDWEVSHDKLVQKVHVVRLDENKNASTEKEKVGSAEITIGNEKGKVQVSIVQSPQLGLSEEDVWPRFLERELPRKDLLLHRKPFPQRPAIGSVLGATTFYDFDPKLSKMARSLAGKVELEGDGSNLSLVLKNIMEDKEKRRMFLNLIKDLLPFVSDLRIKESPDKRSLFYFCEKYLSDMELPAALASDGTINIAALIVALCFEEPHLTIIEEPDRSLHPYLISKVVGMMKEASKTKQIIVTTHNPEMVKHADLDSLVLVARDKEGFSILSRPAEKEHVKTFLANEMGMDELYVQNLLEL